jgi:hypothetical protein
MLFFKRNAKKLEFFCLLSVNLIIFVSILEKYTKFWYHKIEKKTPLVINYCPLLIMIKKLCLKVKFFLNKYDFF